MAMEWGRFFFGCKNFVVRYTAKSVCEKYTRPKYFLLIIIYVHFHTVEAYCKNPSDTSRRSLRQKLQPPKKKKNFNFVLVKSLPSTLRLAIDAVTTTQSCVSSFAENFPKKKREMPRRKFLEFNVHIKCVSQHFPL